jgi:hypothetical protein
VIRRLRSPEDSHRRYCAVNLISGSSFDAARQTRHQSGRECRAISDRNRCYPPASNSPPGARAKRAAWPTGADGNVRSLTREDHAWPRTRFGPWTCCWNFFEDGRRGTRGVFWNRAGERCLVGGINRVRRTYKIRAVAAEAALRQALPPRQYALIGFNDSRKGFAEIRALILKARSIALETPKPHAPAAAARKPVDLAWAIAKVEAAAAEDARRKEAAEPAKRQHESARRPARRCRIAGMGEGQSGTHASVIGGRP